MQNLMFRDDGTVDLVEPAGPQLEAMVNQIMDWQADEVCGEGNRRNGYRERGLLTPVGAMPPLAWAQRRLWRGRGTFGVGTALRLA